MNIKRIFGALFTVLGIIGLVYAAVVFVNSSGGTRSIKTLFIYGILGIVFFIAGIGFKSVRFAGVLLLATSFLILAFIILFNYSYG